METQTQYGKLLTLIILVAGLFGSMQPVYAAKPLKPLSYWGQIDGSYCQADVSQKVDGKGLATLSVGRTADGDTAACLQRKGSSPLLMRLEETRQCVKLNSSAPPALVITVADRKAIRIDPIMGKRKVTCGKTKLSAAKSGAERPLLVADPHGVFARVGGTSPMDTVLKSGGLAVDLEHELAAGETNVVYGTHIMRGRTQDRDMIICADDGGPPRVLGLYRVDVPDLRIAISGNDNNNVLRPATETMSCGDVHEVAPPNPDWRFAQLWLIGRGGDDWLWGIDNANIQNVQFGDYVCNEGPPGEDHLNGGPGNDILAGEQGDDTIWGYGGNDQIYGNLLSCAYIGPDNDRIFGGSGDDTIYGDTCNPDAGGGNDEIFGLQGSDTILGGPGNDQIWGESWPWALTTGERDFLCGDAGADWVDGGPACDEILHDGDDRIVSEPCDLVRERACAYYPSACGVP